MIYSQDLPFGGTKYSGYGRFGIIFPPCSGYLFLTFLFVQRWTRRSSLSDKSKSHHVRPLAKLDSNLHPKSNGLSSSFYCIQLVCGVIRQLSSNSLTISPHPGNLQADWFALFMLMVGAPGYAVSLHSSKQPEPGRRKIPSLPTDEYYGLYISRYIPGGLEHCCLGSWCRYAIVI